MTVGRSYGQLMNNSGEGSCVARCMSRLNRGDPSCISGRVVVHAAIADERVTSWAEVIVEDEAIPF